MRDSDQPTSFNDVKNHFYAKFDREKSTVLVQMIFKNTIALILALISLLTYFLVQGHFGIQWHIAETIVLFFLVGTIIFLTLLFVIFTAMPVIVLIKRI